MPEQAGYGVKTELTPPQDSPQPKQEKRRRTRAQGKGSRATMTVHGLTRTFQEWSRLTGIRVSTMRSRRRSGWSDAKVVGTPLITAKIRNLLSVRRHTVGGVTDTVRGHCERRGVCLGTVRNLMSAKRGLTLAEALLRARSGRHQSFWTTREIKFLRAHLHRSPTWLAERLPRHPYNTVRMYRRRMMRQQGLP